ncbi:MAG: hypothetical protein GY771_11740, partial [bacterium]|nr:hypothetical protein [bacterium]
KPTPYGTWNDVKEVGYHDIVGGIFEVFYPDVSGDCTLNVSTAYGPVTVELGDAGKTFRYAAKVRPGMKAELRTWPSISYAFRELEPGDVVFPTGEAELVEFEGDDVEWLMFQKVTTPLGEDGWIIDDDEVFEYAGYLEAPAE